MEIEAPLRDSPRSHGPTADSLRQRQRDRFLPRGRSLKGPRVNTLVKEVPVGGPQAPAKLSPISGAGTSESPSPERAKRQKLANIRDEEPQLHKRANPSLGEVRLDINPDNTSASREGREFAVANVGNNGRIYLRPTVRPANQRYPQPTFTFPITPPTTAGLDTLTSHNKGEESQHESLWTSRSPPTTPIKQAGDRFFGKAKSTPQLQSSLRRARSQSSFSEYVPVRDSELGAFKIVIDRPSTEKRPKIADMEEIPTLDQIMIPSYKLGTPRFSARGTPFLRGSSYATTEDVRSSVLSFAQGDPSRDRPRYSRLGPHAAQLRRRHSHSSSIPQRPRAEAPSNPETPTIPASSMTGPRVIQPSMFDDLTFKPGCDDRSVVRYSSVSGNITAATPPRLVAEITSPTFLDYELLSDFFLTFRSFLETPDLLAMLIARLRWALARSDEVGMVVRVRTFVALRHWILNYFFDDYVVDYDLRKTFCGLLNAFVDELAQSPTLERNKLKILGELKKCWRRTCSLYWDGPDFAADASPESRIAPGGIAGSRDPNLVPSFWEPPPEPGPPRLDNIFDQDRSNGEAYNFFADVSRAGRMSSIYVKRYVRPDSHLPNQNDPPTSPRSIMSEEVVSCSFPTKSRIAHLGASQTMGAHPVPASSRYDSIPPVAYTPKGLVGKQRPAQNHKRSASFSDSLRDGRGRDEPETVLYKSTELLMSLPHAGSLVRGNLFPPGQAFVDVVAPATPAETVRAKAYFQQTAAGQKGPSAMSGPGMKKLLGSVRKALGPRTGASPNSSPTNGSFPHLPPVGIKGVTINRLPGTAVVPQARSRLNGARAPMRIDLLGAEIAEDFKKAVREDAEAEAGRDRQQFTPNGSIGVASGNEAMYPLQEYEAAQQELQQTTTSRTQMSGITNGSHSILIFDDTSPPGLPIMTGALPGQSPSEIPSTDSITNPYMPLSLDPTPPHTPPDQHIGSPRRSSHLLGQQNNQFELSRSLSLERTPSLVRDMYSPKEQEKSPSFHHYAHRRSTKSHGRGNRSVSLRRFASYQSGFAKHATERSFDATTFSDSNDRISSAIAPAPLHVLRRRPGGDLRAVTNIGELNGLPLRRTKSIGSITTYSDSVRSSAMLGDNADEGYVGVVSSDDYSQVNTGTFSLGALAEGPKRAISLFSTHSSKPVMRPSFEAEAAKLAQIPDDIDDDGGVESALLKLEGKFDEQRRSQTSAPSVIYDPPATPKSFGNTTAEGPSDQFNLDTEYEKRKHRMGHVDEKAPMESSQVHAYKPKGRPSSGDELKPAVYQPTGFDLPIQNTPTPIEEELSSVPLLDRNSASVDESARPESQSWRGASILRDPSGERRSMREHKPESSHSSIEFVHETASLKRVRDDAQHGGRGSKDTSFLDDVSDDGHSDLSSEMSLEVVSSVDLVPEYDTLNTPHVPSCPAGIEYAFQGGPLPVPSSPILPIGQVIFSDNTRSGVPQYQQVPHKTLPPTPEFSPTLGTAREGPDTEDWDAMGSRTPRRISAKPSEASRKSSVHLPFVLAFDSKILAQQFTLIEKDALAELDWKELIEMRWKNISTNTRSWVDFLRSKEARGVEVVIARFNIMVKWAVSECVLTRDVNERAQTIIKYIHIAAHCRRYRNYATLYQITMALTSQDLGRLAKTWALIPEADLATLHSLEALVQPTRNFHTLRAEMEGSGADAGCIPFVGIYTHDLLFNTQKPSVIAGTPMGEPLVNFERCRISAAIVKNLLRLLEASGRYRFRPIEGVTERCLWMAALSDEEIRELGDSIE